MIRLAFGRVGPSGHLMLGLRQARRLLKSKCIHNPLCLAVYNGHLLFSLMASGELFQYYDSMNEINTTRPQIFSGPTASVANRPVDSVGPQELARRNSMIQGQIDHLQRQKAMVDEVVAAKDETKPGTATQTGNVAGD